VVRVLIGIGWLKIYRELGDKAIWIQSTPEQKVILMTLLMAVNYEENEWVWKGKKFKVAPGQMITSLDSIQKKSGKGITVQNVRTALVRFEKLGFLTSESTNEGRLITIVNWSLYQSNEFELTNDSTNPSQTTNKELTPIKERKKEKKEIKEKYGNFSNVLLKNEEYEKLVIKLGESVTKKQIESLDMYIESKGAKYKSHYATILNWINKDSDKNPNASKNQKITIDA